MPTTVMSRSFGAWRRSGLWLTQICLVLAAAWALVVLASAAHARQDAAPPPSSDHDWALQAVRAGEIRSVADILQRLEREFIGHVLEIELERDRDRIVYEVELLSASGHVLKLVYDARTAVLISARGLGLDGARRQSGALGWVRP